MVTQYNRKMALVSSGLQLQILIFSVSAFSYNYLDNSLTVTTGKICAVCFPILYLQCLSSGFGYFYFGYC